VSSRNAGDLKVMTSLAASTALVTGVGRGFGRAIATALASEGVEVIGLVRRHADFPFATVVGDAADPELAASLIERYKPTTIVLSAGAAPVSVPLQDHTWETFSRCWEMDVKQTFSWSRAALLHPLAAGSTVICFSSGAALQGSPLSGGYAGAKATVRFVARYAADESARAGLGIRFTSVLPKLTTATDLGAVAVAAYAARAGLEVPAFLAQLGPTSTPESLAHDIVALAADPSRTQTAYLLDPSGGLIGLDA
jgi:NAD(P)-dependent dehydrogenase (short-subunit alcohol dehydrogenase family)